MRIVFTGLIAAAMLAAAPAFAQEVMVTAQRRSANDAGGGGYLNNRIVSTGLPVIHLTRTADYAVQLVRLVGDTREAGTRREDLRAMVRGAIALAERSGVELATGDYVLQPLTLANHANLPFSGDGRPDTDQTFFLVKTRLVPGMDIRTARERIATFVASVPKVGRSELGVLGEVALSVVNPDQYRGQIIDLIAADAAISAAKFGSGYGVAIAGVDRPVEWARAGPTEVFLFLPAFYTVRRD